MSLFIKFYFTSSMLNMFQTLMHPSSGACDFSIVSPHWLCVLVSMCVGVSVWLGWGGIRVAGFSLLHGYGEASSAAGDWNRYTFSEAHFIRTPNEGRSPSVHPSINPYIHLSIILMSVSRQVHGLRQKKFSTQCDLVLPLSIYNTLSLP